MIHTNLSRLKTLNDVRLVLPAIYSEASCKVYTAAFNKVTRLTGKPLTHVPADQNAWYLFAQTIVWAGAFGGETPGDQKRAFDTWVKKVAAGINRAHDHVALPVTAASEDAAWGRLEAYAKDVENTFDEEGVRLLPNMFSLSIANLRAQCRETHPALLDTDVVSKVIVTCRADKSGSLRNSVSAFNKLIRNQNRHPAICDLLPSVPIGPLPALRDQPLDWSCFGAAFLRSRDRAIQQGIHPDRKRSDRFGGKLGKDLFDGRRRDSRKRKRKVRNPEAARKRHLNALSWLIRHAFPDRSTAYALNSIEALLTVETVEQAVDGYVKRAVTSDVLKDPDKTSSGNSILSSLETLARRNDFPDEVIWAIEDARYDRVDSHQAREMSLEREAFIKLVERDPAVARAIVSGPRRLMMEASEAFANWENLGVRARGEALHLSLGSSLMALQLARAVRSKNLNEMTTGGDNAELVRPLRNSKPWIDIARSKVKNRRPIEGEIPDRQWHVIKSWLDDGLPRWCALHGLGIEKNIHLVPGPNGILSRHSFNRIWNRCMDRLGIPGLQPHMMRHVAATLWLAANPGDYATVAAFLGDSVKTVEKFYARGEGAAAAKLFAQVLESVDPTLNAFLCRSTP